MDYEEGYGGAGHLIECNICGRRFASEALSRHKPICMKASQKKRKIFDSSKQRAEGTELVQFQRKNPAARRNDQSQPARAAAKNDQSQPARAAAKRPEPASKKNNWRQKHVDFINTIRAARGVKLAMERGEPLPPPPPPSFNPDYIQCDYCGRRFAESAAQRHIDFCKEQHERLPLKKKPDYAAAQKQATRLQYQPPKLRKAAPSYQQPSAHLDYTDDGGYSAGGYHSAGYSASNQGYSSASSKVPSKTSLRGRGGPSVQTASRNSRNVNDYPPRADRPPSGQALRTGRTAQTYSEARQLSAKQRAGMPSRKFPSSDNIHGSSSSGYGSPQYTGTGFTPSGRGYSTGNSSGYGVSTRTGYGGSTVTTPRGRGGNPAASRPSPGAVNSFTGRFCYDCGAKFPAPQAKFCSECGAKKTVNA